MPSTTTTAFWAATPVQDSGVPCGHPWGYTRLVPLTDTANNAGVLFSAVTCSRCASVLYLDSGPVTR